MSTRSGAPYQPQANSELTMDPNLVAILKNLTDQLSNITTRLDYLEAREPQRTHEAPVGVEPELEFDMPHNPRRAYQEPAYEPNPRRPNHY